MTADQWLLWDRGLGGMGGRITKYYEETFWDDRYTHFFFYNDDGFVNMYVCQNLTNCIFKFVQCIYYMSIIPQPKCVFFFFLRLQNVQFH